MFNWLEHATRIKEREFVRNAEEQQLIREAMAAHQKDDPFYYQTLAALGRRLSAWGEQLQERYDHVSEMPLELPPLGHAHE